jgi:hypothetical protein
MSLPSLSGFELALGLRSFMSVAFAGVNTDGREVASVQMNATPPKHPTEKARNPNDEIRNKFELRNFKKNQRCLSSNLFRTSYFEFRISSPLTPVSQQNTVAYSNPNLFPAPGTRAARRNAGAFLSNTEWETRNRNNDPEFGRERCPP